MINNKEKEILDEIKSTIFDLEKQIESIKEFLDCKYSENSCKKPEKKCECKEKETLKPVEELTLGEKFVIEALQNELISDKMNRNEMIESLLSKLIADPVWAVVEKTLRNYDNNSLLKEYYNIVTELTSSLLNVDISKLRILQ